jgi:hypothetical protein
MTCRVIFLDVQERDYRWRGTVMKALSHNYLIWLAVFSLHAPVINTNISPYFRSKGI